METIFIVAMTYFKENHEIDFTEEINQIFTNEEDAKGYCNLMNVREYNWQYSYKTYKICREDYKRYA